MECDAQGLPEEIGGFEIGGLGGGITRGFEIEVMIPLVGAGRPRMVGMGATGMAAPIENGGALDGGPIPEIGLEGGGVFDGLGGKGRAKNEKGYGQKGIPDREKGKMLALRCQG